MVQPSISMPKEMQDEIDDRRHSTVFRNVYVQEAILVRFLLEDLGNWDEQFADARRKYSEFTGDSKKTPVDQ